MIETLVTRVFRFAATKFKDITGIVPGYYVGAALIVGAGIVAIFLGVKAEGETLENIAKPLTAEDSMR